MTEKQKADRQKRAQALVDLVEKVEGGYRVYSSRDPNTAYFVSKPNGHITCTCPDYEKHAEEVPRWHCKHVEACILAHKQGRLNGSSSTPVADLQTSVQDLEETPVGTEVPAEETVHLEPCMTCGVKLAVDELIPMRVPSGFGLVCRDCFGPEMRSCGYCGEKFTVDELTPIDTQFGSILACEICHEEAKARKAAEASPITVPTRAERIARANELLASWEPSAIEADHNGRVGYGGQWVIDAANAALGVDAWRYELVSHQWSEKKAMVQLALYLRLDDSSWFTKGPIFGSSQNPDLADALKGATTDGLKKAFSHWGLGNRAYRGELRTEKK